MEIDLNLAASDEMEKNASPSPSSSSSSSLVFASSSSSSSLHTELWHACAGPVDNQTKKGDLVVYFPQRHLENAHLSAVVSPTEKQLFDLPPQILCKVVGLQLVANKENDEVYTQLTLHPMQQMVGSSLGGKEGENVGVDERGNEELPAKSTSHMFRKTLTASDTSSHGGFSVPRRAAEDCFPPLNYEEERPSQELVATDLHGMEWRFRHIYRGQPRRHLLTTGWSIFVSQKNLASGDAVLFLRGESGELRLGIRRAARPRDCLPDSVIKNQNCYISHVANALSSNGMFNLVYSPRENHSDFIVPYHKYLKSTASTAPVGTRFKMEYDVDDDSPERRLSRMKRLRSNLQGSPKVLQGQENAVLASPVHRSDPANKHLHRMERISNSEFVRNQAAPTITGFVESSWFPKVLQGQEICSFRSLTGCSVYKAYQFPTPSFYPLASKGVRNIPFFFNSRARNPILTGRSIRSEASLHSANEQRSVEENLYQKLALRRCLFD